MNSPIQTARKVRAPQASAAPRPAAGLYWALLAPVLALAAVLRFVHIGDKSFWMDEGVSYTINHLSWIDFLHIAWRRELNMLPYYVLLRGWMKFGTSEAFLRSLSAIFSVATIVVLYLLGGRLLGRRGGMYAGLLAAVHAWLVRYAQEARSYSLAIFLVTLSCLFFVRNVQEPERKGWTAYIVTAVLAVYSHFFALLVVLAQWVALRCVPRTDFNRAGVHRAWKIAAVCLLPLIVFIASRGAGPIAWIRRPTAASFYYFLLALTGNGGNVLLVLYFALAAMAAAMLILRRAQVQNSRARWGIVFALSWLVAPIAVTLIFSLARPVFLSRYLVYCVPALVLLAAAGLVRLPSIWLQAAVVLLLAWFSGQGIQSYYRGDFDLSREDWRAATRYVLSETEAGDGVIFHAALGRMPFEYYVARAGKGAAKPAIAFPNSGPKITYSDFVANAKNAPVNGIAHEYSRVWLVLAHNQLPGNGADDVTRKLEWGLANDFPCATSRQFSEIAVRLYSRDGCFAGE